MGLVNTVWGGTAIEEWLPAAADAECTPRAPGGMVETEAPSEGGPPPLVETEAGAERATEVAFTLGSASTTPFRRASAAAAAAGDLGVAGELYNAMVAPLLNLTIRGVVWYQGESNAQAAHRYTCQIQALVRHWRRAWHEGSGGETSAAFPFGIVQVRVRVRVGVRVRGRVRVRVRVNATAPCAAGRGPA